MKKNFIFIAFIIVFLNGFIYPLPKYIIYTDPSYIKFAEVKKDTKPVAIGKIADKREFKQKNTSGFLYAGKMGSAVDLIVLNGYDLDKAFRSIITDSLMLSGYDPDAKAGSCPYIDIELIEFHSKWYVSEVNAIVLKIKLTLYSGDGIKKLLEMELGLKETFISYIYEGNGDIKPTNAEAGTISYQSSWQLALNKLSSFLTVFLSSDAFRKAYGGEINDNVLFTDLSQKSMETFTYEGDLKNAAAINLSNNALTELNLKKDLDALKILDLRQNKIQDLKKLIIPDSVEALTLKNNGITKIENLNGLNALQMLDIGFNKITKIENLDNLLHLKCLIIDECSGLTKIDNINHMKALTVLDLSDCDNIVRIENINNLTDLRFLTLSNCRKIVKLEGLDNLTKLKHLDLTNTRIKKLENLDSLTELEYLNLNHTRIEKIENLDKLKSLKKLSIYMSSFTVIENLENLSNLKEIMITKHYTITENNTKINIPKAITKSTYDFLTDKKVMIDGNMTIEEFVKKHSLQIK